jgi:hypothetical protein
MKKIILLLVVAASFNSCGIFVKKRNATPIGPEIVMKYFDGNGRPTGYRPKNKKEIKEYKDVVSQMKQDEKLKIKKEAISNY